MAALKVPALLSLLAVCLLAVSLTACSGGGTTTSKLVDMNLLRVNMMSAASLRDGVTSVSGNMEDAEKNFSYISTLSYDKVADYFIVYSTEGTADEIAVIAVKDAADVSRAHVDDRLKLFQQYGPDQASRVEKAEIFTKDQYAVLLICDDSDAVKTAFEDFLSSNN